VVSGLLSRFEALSGVRSCQRFFVVIAHQNYLVGIHWQSSLMS
jgi:hypothetical protein